MSNEKIMFLFARTPVHVGAGNSVGAVDAPVMRQRHTGTPVIPGSSLKGVISDLWNDADGKRTKEGNELFGTATDDKELTAGKVLFGEASVLAFPVRSAKNAFAWITCPTVLNKFSRCSGVKFEIPALGEEECLASSELQLKDNSGKQLVILEEYGLTCKGEAGEIAGELLAATFGDDELWNTVKNRMAIVSDEMFSYFVRNACEVVTRIRIDDTKGVVAKGALFNQEQVPSETLFYSVIGEVEPGKIEKMTAKMPPVIQVGGDATVGLGFCQVNFK
jgi:CRISPR-associated protein Cmr4